VSETRSVLALFAKAPVPGQVKTRLCPPLRPEQAAELYEAMLLDILDQHRATPGVDLALWYTPAAARPWFEAHAPRGCALHAQRGPSLAPRMSALFRQHAEQGYTRMVLRGTDSPSLPEARFSESFEALERADLVLCPDRDGGYNLIGLRGAADALFDVEMSTANVLEWTVERGKALGMRVELLAPHHDVDTVADLKLLANELCERRTPRTRAWLVRAGFEVAP
jgi:rSAM/selenodomain-associated transferase 1